MKLLALLASALALALLPPTAFAQTAAVTAPAADPVTLSPLVTTVGPILNAILVQGLIPLLVTAILGIIAPFVPTMFKGIVENFARNTLLSAAQTWAGNVLAKYEGDVSKMAFDVSNPLVRQGVEWIINTGAPAAVKRFGLTPDDIAQKIVGEIGKLQIGSTAASTTEVASPGK